MENTVPIGSDGKAGAQLVRVWDLPTRLFHWLLVILVAISFVTAAMGGGSMQYHVKNGYLILTLLLFRVVWGFVGGGKSRFATFARGPKAVKAYAAALFGRDYQPHLGHNPLGGWSVLAMLLVLLVQVGSGLFANDGIATQGPLAVLISNQTSALLTEIHEINQGFIIFLVTLHVLAIFFYLFFKGENLIKPMITGLKQWAGKTAQPVAGRIWLALVIIVVAALAVYLLVRS